LSTGAEAASPHPAFANQPVNLGAITSGVGQVSVLGSSVMVTWPSAVRWLTLTEALAGNDAPPPPPLLLAPPPPPP
jgi:hypothetical protein